jgi:hypothetical protein
MKSTVIQRVLICLGVLISGLLVSCQPEEVEEPAIDLTGSWSCTETSGNPSSSSTFTIHIKKSGSGYTMENFYNLGFNHTATLSVTDKNITIPNQSIAGFSVSGSGTISTATKVNLSYQADDGSGSNLDNCTATLAKQ